MTGQRSSTTTAPVMVSRILMHVWATSVWLTFGSAEWSSQAAGLLTMEPATCGGAEDVGGELLSMWLVSLHFKNDSCSLQEEKGRSGRATSDQRRVAHRGRRGPFGPCQFGDLCIRRVPN